MGKDNINDIIKYGGFPLIGSNQSKALDKEYGKGNWSLHGGKGWAASGTARARVGKDQWNEKVTVYSKMAEPEKETVYVERDPEPEDTDTGTDDDQTSGPPEKTEGHQATEEAYLSHFKDGNPWDPADPVRAYKRAFEDAKAIGQQHDAGFYLRRLSKDKQAAVSGYMDYLSDANKLVAHEQNWSAMGAIDRIDELGVEPPEFSDPYDLFKRYRDELKEDFD